MKSTTTMSWIALSACAGSTPDPTGRWGSACLSQAQADGSTSYYDLNFDIEADTWALDYVVYGDAQCQARLVTVHIDGPYEVGEPVEGLAAHAARFGFEHKTITPHVDGLVAALTQQGCGNAPWVIDQPQDVLAQGCAGFGQYPKAQCAADYDLLRVDGARLWFGLRPANNDLCTPERRPTQLNPVPFEKRS